MCCSHFSRIFLNVFEFRYHYPGPISDLGGCELQFRLFGESLEYSRWLLASHRPQQVCSLPATLLLYCPSARPENNLQKHPVFLRSEARSVNYNFMGILLGTGQILIPGFFNCPIKGRSVSWQSLTARASFYITFRNTYELKTLEMGRLHRRPACKRLEAVPRALLNPVDSKGVGPCVRPHLFQRIPGRP
jgi:hypothetical protein